MRIELKQHEKNQLNKGQRVFREIETIITAPKVIKGHDHANITICLITMIVQNSRDSKLYINYLTIPLVVDTPKPTLYIKKITSRWTFDFFRGTPTEIKE